MSGDSKAISGHVLLIRLGDEDVGPSGNDPMIGDWMDL